MRKNSLAKRVAVTLSVALAVSLGIAGTAWAYYTDTSKAAGMIQFKYDLPTTKVQETREGTNKVISVKNTGEVNAMVRVKVFDPDISGVELTFKAAEGWTQDVNDNGEKWWYYTQPIAPGDSTPKLKAEVTVNAAVDHGFDVIVVQQCASAMLFGTVTEDGKAVLGKFADGKKYLSAASVQEGE